MKKEDLFKAIGDVDDAFLDENVTEIKHDTRWITAVLSIAACAALTAGLIHFVPKPARQPQEEIKVASSETTVTTVAETVTDVSADWTDETIASEDYRIYVNYKESDIITKEDLKRPKTIKEIMAKTSVPYIEICIDEKNGYISMLTAEDSNSLPKVGVLTRTETGYDCQINGEQFFLQDISGFELIFRSDKSIYEGITYEGRLLEPRNNADHLFQKIKDEEAESVSIDTPNGSVILGSEAVSEFMEIFRNIGTYCKSLAHQSGEYQFTVTLKDGTVYEIEPTQSFLKIDGMVYHAEEATRQALAEFYQNYLTEDIPEDVPETTVPETSEITPKSTTSTEVTIEGVILPYTTTKDQLSPEPQVLPYTTTEGETQPEPQVLPYTKLQTETTTTVTEAVTELSAEISEIPEEVQNIMYEDDTSGIIFSRIQPEDETHIEIAVENGCYLESNLSDAIRYYPEKKYAVSMQVFSHLLLQDIEEELAGKGIQILGHRESDGRILAIMTEEQLNQLNQTETMGFLIDLTSQQN
ncbi:MAG: hypothetical protein IJ644_09735 [Oscillospiraceae bacterium]|nr:hypothetical protein [Oscillospiraceae bacterium]